MKILLCANTDYGGGTWFLAQAINRYTEHEARQFKMIQSALGYPYHILSPSRAEMRALVEWCDVLHMRETVKFLPSGCLRKQQRPTVMTYCGRGYRKSAKKLIESNRALGWVVTVSTPDLPFYYPGKPPLWIPNTREDMIDYPSQKYHQFTVAHAPTFRERKGTETVIKAIQGLNDVGLDLIEKETYSQCLQRKAECHLLVDQFANGYGNNTIEAWALGIPVITNDEKTQFTHHLEEACGYLPFVKAPEDAGALREIIDRLHKDKAFYAEMLEKGRRFFFTYHHAPAVAQRVIEIYEMALDGSHKTNYPTTYPRAPKRQAPMIIKKRELNILSLATWDYAGCGYFLSEAINATTHHHSQAVRWRPGSSRLQFPHDIVSPSLDELADLWKLADVVHIHDNVGARDNYHSQSPEILMIKKLPPRPTIITYHGSRYRKHHEYFNRLAGERGWVQTCSTLDLTLHGACWLPDCRPDLSKYVNRPKDHFIVCQAPTKHEEKGVPTVIAAMKGFFDFELIKKMPWQECIEHKGRASVLIDQFWAGYGCNSIEAWTMSQATVGNALPEVLKLYNEHIGYIPFVCCPCESGAIREAVERLRDDADYYHDAVERGRQCYRDFHSPEAVAKQALTYYHQAMLRGPAILGRPGSDDEMQHKASPELPKSKVGELTLIEYIGPNAGDMTWHGGMSRQYKLGGVHKRGYVYAEDVPGLLAATDRQGKSVFRIAQ